MGADEAAAAQHLGGAESRAVRMDPTGGAGTPASDLDLDGPTSAGRLTAVLLPPGLRAALPARGELVVLPAGPLALVPFAALMLDDTVPLGARHALRYAPSLAALAEAERRPSAGRGTAGVAALRASLVVGNPAMPDVGASTGRRLRLSALPAAEREARWVAARLGARSRTGTVASETAVRGLIGAAPVVHFATHGFAYSSDALARSSFVAFAADSANDGLLTAGEVVDELPRLHADLVVLSACQTGLGNLKSAEGTVGLQRAFLAHGARSVLVTLWSISDDATARLMQGFYTHWLGDADRPDKAEALRRAQEALRRTPGFSDPLYWAGFQLVGGS
jgi:CHAT domain-containing protein